MLRVNDQVEIPEGELEERFVHAGGPGGQHVNKAATAVQLRFDAAGSTVLGEGAKRRLLRLAGQRATDAGAVLILASDHRSREQNRSEARARLAKLVRRALRRPKPRKKTRPTRASRERRLSGKKRRSEIKKLRRTPNAE
jgi:ribosome-associated protein